MATPRGAARALGIPFDALDKYPTGPLNAIIDVDQVSVGHSVPDPNLPPPNTGVTAILPIGNVGAPDPSRKATTGPGNGIDTFVMAAWYTINGNGEMTGTHLIDETGFLEGPILLTNTVAVGTVRNSVIQYSINQQDKQQLDPDKDYDLYLPVVAETYDGYLNDILNPNNVTDAMVQSAIDSARSNKNATAADVVEGNVGAGTGTTCYSWKGGIGTASRRATVYGADDTSVIIPNPNGTNFFTVGVLVQANQGVYWDLVIRGVPVGQDPQFAAPPKSPDTPPGTSKSRARKKGPKSSIIVVIATDAPLLPTQLKRLARRATHGIARTGTPTDDDSGEIFIAFSTANPDASADDIVASAGLIPNDSMDPLFEATVQATEEAILNALIAAKYVKGRAGNEAYAIKDMPPASSPSSLSLVQLLQKYNRYSPPSS
jgi:L-aminopeptidase/D-esterase-like protein